MSHDIRTPMTSILGYMQFLEDETIPPHTRQEYMLIVKSSALRLKVLLEDFLSYPLLNPPTIY